MTTVAERLVELARTGGAAGDLMLMIGQGATYGDALTDYSGLTDATALEMLLVNADEGGDGKGKSRGGRRRRQGRMVWLEHEGKIVVFDSAAQADAWLAAQAKPKAKKKPVLQAIPESAEVLDTTALGVQFQIFAPDVHLQELLAANQLRQVLEIHQRIQMHLQDEEDIEMLLLAV